MLKLEGQVDLRLIVLYPDPPPQALDPAALASCRRQLPPVLFEAV